VFALFKACERTTRVRRLSSRFCLHAQFYGCLSHKEQFRATWFDLKT
jgi:hypothetical protein